MPLRMCFPERFTREANRFSCFRPDAHTLYQCVRGEAERVLREDMEERINLTARYIVEHGATVRDAAKAFSVGKSTVHKDMAERLRTVNPSLYRSVRAVLDTNKAERHIRGGRATQQKYRKK